MKLGEDARKCVVYLGYGTNDENGIDPEGTGFLVCHGDPLCVYLITARHVAKALGTDPFVVRMNEKGGEGKNIHVDNAQWHYHPEGETVDVAVLPCKPPDWADITFFPSRGFLVDEKLASKEIGGGDLAYVVGVFSLLHGKKRNLPMVHTGHVALLPDDEPIPMYAYEAPLEDKDGKKRVIEVKGYVVEANTYPRSSGSPVFVRRSIEHGIPKKGGKLEAWVYGSRWLLGIWQGTWGDETENFVIMPTGKERKSLGLGGVVPAKRIIEVLDNDVLTAARERLAAAEKRQRAMTPQSARSTTADNPSHKEAFTSLVDAAARKRKLAD